MEQEEAAAVLASLRAELGVARRSAEEARRRVGALEKLIEGYVELFPGLAEPGRRPADESSGNVGAATNGARPKGQEAVSRVLGADEFRGRLWTVAQVTEELEKRGWLPEPRDEGRRRDYDPRAAVRSALDRLVEADRRVHKGRDDNGSTVFSYRQKPEDAPIPPRSPGAPESHLGASGG